MKNSNLILSLTKYFEYKKIALLKIKSFRPPADLLELEFYHSVYLCYLLSAIDLVRDSFGDEFIGKLKEDMSLPEYLDGVNNYLYLRELRNTLIHRDPHKSPGGIVVNEMVCPIAPKIVENEKDSRTYKSFGYLLIDIINVCEKVVGEVVYKVLNDNKYFEDVEELQCNQVNKDALSCLLESIESSQSIPNQYKEMAKESDLSIIDFCQISKNQNLKLKELLLGLEK